MSKARKKTKDGLHILHQCYYAGRPERLAALKEMRAAEDVARQILKLRTDAGFSQRELARLVGTTASVVCGLEDADYESHSLAVLRRIAAALQSRVEIRFIPVGKLQVA